MTPAQAHAALTAAMNAVRQAQALQQQIISPLQTSAQQAQMESQ